MVANTYQFVLMAVLLAPGVSAACGTYKTTTYTAKTSVEATTCKGDGACFTKCCEEDVTVCSNKFTSGWSCASDKYSDTTKFAVKWGTDAASFKTNCCTDKAKCSASSCNTMKKGWKKKASVDAVTCDGDTKSCNSVTCCEKDNTKCGSIRVACGSDKFQDASKNDVVAGNTTQVANCCSAILKCSSYTCTSGTKKKPSPPANCDTTGVFVNRNTFGGTSICAGADSDRCCTYDTSKCEGIIGVFCNDGYFTDTAKNNVAATSADFKSKCCTAHPQKTCGSYWKEGGSSTSGVARVSLLSVAALGAVVVTLASVV